MDDVLVVFPTPLAGEDNRLSGPPRLVAVLALHGSPRTGWQEDRTALVVDAHGNCDWIDTDGLAILVNRPEATA